MILWVQEIDLSSPIKDQKITVPSDSPGVISPSIRVHMYRHNHPAGSVKVQVYESDNTTLRMESDYVVIDDMDLDVDPVGEDFFHGMIRFDLDGWLDAGEDYFVRMVTTGYTFSEAAYVGMVKDYDLRTYEAVYTVNDGASSAYHLEVWDNTKVVRG